MCDRKKFHEDSRSPTMLAAALLCSSVLAFTPTARLPTSNGLRLRSSSSVLMKEAPRGFGKPSPAIAKNEKPAKKSAGAVKRDARAEAFDDLKAGGAPEYMVLIRTVDASGEASKWYPVGGIAVPRSSSEDQAL